MSSSAAHNDHSPKGTLPRPRATARGRDSESILSRSVLDTTSALRSAFPDDPHLQRLVALTAQWSIRLAPSPVHEQWLYHPEFRTLFVWEPDLTEQPLLYLAVILAHELGHALDFDERPELREATRSLHWSDVPDWVEESAFIQGFSLLRRVGIPIAPETYAAMIEEPMASRVRRTLEAERASCLMSG